MEFKNLCIWGLAGWVESEMSKVAEGEAKGCVIFNSTNESPQNIFLPFIYLIAIFRASWCVI
jgi:hypothetical protein